MITHDSFELRSPVGYKRFPVGELRSVHVTQRRLRPTSQALILATVWATLGLASTGLAVAQFLPTATVPLAFVAVTGLTAAVVAVSRRQTVYELGAVHGGVNVTLFAADNEMDIAKVARALKRAVETSVAS